MPDQAGHDRKRQSSLRFPPSPLRFSPSSLRFFSVILAHPSAMLRAGARIQCRGLSLLILKENNPGCPIKPGMTGKGSRPYAFLRHPCVFSPSSLRTRGSSVVVLSLLIPKENNPGCPIGAGHDRSGHPYVFLPHPCIFSLSSLRTRGSSVVILCSCPRRLRAGLRPGPVHFIMAARTV